MGHNKMCGWRFLMVIYHQTFILLLVYPSFYKYITLGPTSCIYLGILDAAYPSGHAYPNSTRSRYTVGGLRVESLKVGGPRWWCWPAYGSLFANEDLNNHQKAPPWSSLTSQKPKVIWGQKDSQKSSNIFFGSGLLVHSLGVRNKSLATFSKILKSGLLVRSLGSLAFRKISL